MNFDSSQPIYRQIIDAYKKSLIRGEIKIGDKIPSQREYAQTLRINPNTVQRAYREMEVIQMVETVRGQGTYICATESMLTQFKEEMARQVLTYFIVEMRSLGFDDCAIQTRLSQKLEGGEKQ